MPMSPVTESDSSTRSAKRHSITQLESSGLLPNIGTPRPRVQVIALEINTNSWPHLFHNLNSEVGLAYQKARFQFLQQNKESHSNVGKH